MDLYIGLPVIILLTSLLYRLYRNRKNRFNVFKSVGIPGPKPNIIFGNLQAFKDVGQHKKWLEWTATYGETYGYYEGPKAVLVTSNVELLKQVMIKEFNKFAMRKPHPMLDKHDKYRNMLFEDGIVWKRLRSICSPSFSTRRMKEMSPLIQNSITTFLQILEKKEKAGKAFDIYSEFQKLTLTVIANVAFGIDIKPMTDPDDGFLNHARQMFSIAERKTRSWRHIMLIPIAVVIPEWFGAVFHYIRPYVKHPRLWFLEAAKQILHIRMNNKSGRMDFVQLMLDARLSDDPQDLTMTIDEKISEVTALAGNNEKVDENVTELRNKHTKTMSNKMTIEEMQGQSVLFLLAGYETTSTALGFMVHIMATHPDVQTKMQAEVDQYFQDKDCEVDYESVQNLAYMDMVLCECLRMYPIAAIVTTRVASEDVLLEGVRIKKGMMIQANVEAVHYNRDLWGPEDPNHFVPERFLPERKVARHPCAWLPFGAGPRNCVGMRFALIEAKLALLNLIQNYTVLCCDETQQPIPINKHAIRSPAEGVWIKLARR